MFIEKIPKEGDTVKVFLSFPTEIKIGIFIKIHDGRAIIDIGNRLLYIDRQSTFYVLNNR